MPLISPRWLEHTDRILRDAALDGQFRLPYLINSLAELGFVKIRYFEYSSCAITKNNYFVLRGASSDIDIKTIRDARLPADEINNFMLPSALPVSVSYAASFESPKELQEFHKCIGSEGMPTLFMPIQIGRELVGKLCACWHSNKNDLTEDDKAALELLSRLVGRYNKLAQDVQIRELELRIMQIKFEDNDEGFVGAHRAFLKVLFAACPSVVAAIFEHNWSNNSLSKIVEEKPATGSHEWFSEKYYRGENVTGFALAQDKPMIITDVDDLSDVEYPTPDEESVKRHAALLGRPLSVAFSKFESGHRDFIVRLSSRQSSISSHFSNQDQIMLSRLCRRFGWLSNDYANKRNLWIIDKLFQLSISDFSEYQSVVKEFEKIYMRVFEAPIVLVSTLSQSSAVTHVCCSDETVLKRVTKISGGRLRDFETQKFSQSNICVMARSRFNALLGVEAVLQTEGSHIFAIRLTDAELSGILYVPVTSRSSEQEIFQHLKEKTKTTLQIVASIIASAISASSKHITTENAKRLIGQIGHEVESPINDLVSAATHALYKLEDEIRRQEFDPNMKMALLRQITGTLTKVDEATGEIAILMDLAVDMAQETENRLEVTFRTINLYELMYQAAESVKREINRYQAQGTRINFDFDEPSMEFTSVVADRVLLSRIFLNLFRNAAKYSNPPGRGRAIEVRIFTRSRSSFIEIEVSNWGVPVRPGDFERIFEPFQRGIAKDTQNARRGMGLGLYIARRFAKAHDGTVKCLSSEPTLSDPMRRLSEGYETKFLLQISSALAPTVSQRTIK